MSDETLRWRVGANAAMEAISAAQASGEWDSLDALALAIGVGDDPEDRGAWEAICEALLRPARVVTGR